MIASRFTQSQSKSKSPSEVRLVEVLDAYLAAAQEGRAPARDELLADHPELAEDLEACLASLEFIRQASLSNPLLVADAKAVEASEGEAGIGDLGDFRLIAEVGRGGMGVVYEAVQRSLNRRVALKVLPFAAAMDPTQLRRFQTEALAAAQLHHTHIVPVYSVGCERGVHYYAMQFIEGQTLAQAIAERRRIQEPLTHPVRRGAPATAESAACVRRGYPDPAGVPDRRSPDARRGYPDPAGVPDRRSPIPDSSPTPHKTTGSAPSSRSREYFRTAAALGIQAAEALDHAHKVGIVHRDVKPANLLLDIPGNLWITDFGLARLSDDAGLTITGDLLGTLRYMSPEQALAKRGYLDHRTDIYSLGATLYELVTLRPAVDGQDRQEVLRKIAQDEPTPPRRFNTAIPRELETILLKAMNKEPVSRYATAQELADDLRRYLDQKPIKAKRPTVREHVAKWSRRHQMVVTTSVLFLVLVVVTLATSAVVIVRKQREVEKQRDEARQAVNDMYTDVAEEWLAQQAALEPLQRKFLQKTLDYYQRFASENSTDPKDRYRTAQAYNRVGVIQEKLGRYHEAQVAYRQGMTVLMEVVADVSDVPEYERELAGIHSNLGDMLTKMGKHAEGEQLLRKAIALGEKVVAGSPRVPQYRSGLATFYENLSIILWKTGRPSEAEQALRRAIALREELVSSSPSAPKYRRELARSHSNLGILLQDTGRWREAEHAFGQAVTLGEKLVADSPAVPEYRSNLAQHHNNLGMLLYMSGQRVEAEQAYRRANNLLEKLAADSPSVPEYRDDLALSHNGLGAVWMIDRPADAAQAFRRAIALQEKLVADSPSVPQYRSDLAASHGNLGEVLKKTGHHAEAEEAYRRALALDDKLAAEWPSVPQYQCDQAIHHTDLGNVLTETGRRAEAEQSYRRAIRLDEKLAADAPSMPQYRSGLASSRKDLGDLLAQTGRPAEAEQAYRQAIDLFEKLVTESPSVSDYQNSLAKSNARLASLLQAAGSGEEAKQKYRRAIALLQKLTDAESQNELAWILATVPDPRIRDPQLAIRLAKKAVERASASGDYWNTLGVAHYRAGDWKAAIEAVEQSMQLRAGGDPSVWFFLAMAHWQKGEKDQARQWYDKAVNGMEKNKSQDEELRRFRAEAAALLGVTEHPKSTGKKEEDTTQRSKP